jgi:MOSC domain-containing protein YiiM
MRLVSVNVGLPREVIWKGRVVTTGIFKEPVAGRVRVRWLNLDGDRQADLQVHGGPDKAIYAYPSEHYDYWRGELPGMELPWGMFGENFTTEGLLENQVNVGDRFRIGSAEVVVTQPRMPCYKLGVKFGRDDMLKRFLASGRTGFYLKVLAEGEGSANDPIERLSRDLDEISITTLVRLHQSKEADPTLLHRAIQVEALAEGWRRHFREQLEEIEREIGGAIDAQKQ